MGNRAQADILRHLAVMGEANIGKLGAELEMTRPSLNRHLKSLEDLGLVIGDPAPGLRQGRDTTYTQASRRIRELSDAYIRYIAGN
ncbi:ArsR/SmtB family transcription factor [Paenarthrobacter sp. NPDC057355]|uniref:ArsR/SmtB family transcription factor n=1 Tax=Paenarthrobacter sp. NPDC057355 TaxID=3346105 RepID=UPI0036340854